MIVVTFLLHIDNICGRPTTMYQRIYSAVQGSKRVRKCRGYSPVWRRDRALGPNLSTSPHARWTRPTDWWLRFGQAIFSSPGVVCRRLSHLWPVAQRVRLRHVYRYSSCVFNHSVNQFVYTTDEGWHKTEIDRVTEKDRLRFIGCKLRRLPSTNKNGMIYEINELLRSV